MPKKFSFVFPTRERPDLLGKFIGSVYEMTKNLDDVEVLIAVDMDDHITHAYLQERPDIPFLRVFPVERSLNFSRDYYSYLASHSTGEYIITANDDCVIETPNWDVIAYETLKIHGGVVYGWMEDLLGKHRAKYFGNYCCFPLFGRAGYEALGYIFPERIPTWGADIWAHDLYEQIGAVVEIPVTFAHYCHHNETREQDAISKRIAENQVAYSCTPTYDEINKLLRALRSVQHAS